MKLLLTTSRKTSLRVRQFLKELSFLFPKENVQRSNRGKRSLEELFEQSNSKYDGILVVTNKHGNPNKIIGFKKQSDNDFKWWFEFKIRFVKLSYEFDVIPINHPKKSEVSFENFESELEQILTAFFEPFLGKLHQSYDANFLQIQFKHTSDGFQLFPIDENYMQLPPVIIIDEILIEDPEIMRES